MDPEREGAKRRTDKRNPADVTPQEPQILQRLYEPHVGPVTGQGSNFTMKNIALKPKKKPLGTTFSSSTSSSGLKKNPSISTLLTSNDSMDSKNLPAPILSSSKSAATLLTPTLHPSLQNVSVFVLQKLFFVFL
jgi:hypothetical protein